jgi:hypothetical protein
MVLLKLWNAGVLLGADFNRPINPGAPAHKIQSHQQEMWLRTFAASAKVGFRPWLIGDCCKSTMAVYFSQWYTRGVPVGMTMEFLVVGWTSVQRAASNLRTVGPIPARHNVLSPAVVQR